MGETVVQVQELPVGACGNIIKAVWVCVCVCVCYNIWIDLCGTEVCR